MLNLTVKKTSRKNTHLTYRTESLRQNRVKTRRGETPLKSMRSRMKNKRVKHNTLYRKEMQTAKKREKNLQT